MRIINPSYGVSPTAAAQSTADRPPIDWRSDPIVMFSNSKPMGELSAKVAKLLKLKNVSNKLDTSSQKIGH